MEFSMNVFKKIKNVDKIKNVKNVKNVTGIKNVFLHLWLAPQCPATIH